MTQLGEVNFYPCDGVVPGMAIGIRNNRSVWHGDFRRINEAPKDCTSFLICNTLWQALRETVDEKTKEPRT